MRCTQVKILSSCLAILCTLSSFGQLMSPEAEGKLASDYRAIQSANTDESKMEASALFKASLKSKLYKQGVMEFPFDSLQMCKKIAPDGRFRIINWNVPLLNGTDFYEALLIIPKEKTGMVDVVELKDESLSITKPEDRVLKSDKWFGALYYEIVPFKKSGGDHYIFLGWDGDTRITTRKVLDVLVLNGNNIRFGSSAFKTEKGMKKRLLFTYADEVSMSVVYQEKNKRIVFDHLAPHETRLEGQYQFYGPDMSFDALELEKGKWVWKSNVDFKRKRTGKDKDFNDPRIR